MAKYIFGFLVGLVVGAIFHERDLARNFAETGDAKAWVTTIKVRP